MPRRPARRAAFRSSLCCGSGRLQLESTRGEANRPPLNYGRITCCPVVCPQLPLIWHCNVIIRAARSRQIQARYAIADDTGSNGSRAAAVPVAT